jgi:hypothetical protein
MSAERDIGGEPNKREHELYNSLIISLLAFLVTFVLLRWILRPPPHATTSYDPFIQCHRITQDNPALSRPVI